MRPLLVRASWFVASSVLGGGCDLGTKAWAERSLADQAGHSATVVEPWLEFSLTYNRGTAFSFIPDLGDTRWIFGLMAFVVVGLVALMALRKDVDRRDRIALGAIAGGAIGNGVDRLVGEPPGVVDFVKVYLPGGGAWPTFNVADVLIGVGAAWILGRQLLSKPPPDPEDGSPDDADAAALRAA